MSRLEDLHDVDSKARHVRISESSLEKAMAEGEVENGQMCNYIVLKEKLDLFELRN